MTMNELLARESIRATIARYTIAGDRLHKEEFLSTFTVDAIIEGIGRDAADSFRYEGRDAIGEWIERWADGSTTKPTHRASFVRHHLSTCHIKLMTAGNAQARTYWVAWTDIGPDHAGCYIDSFRCENDAWLIEHRRIREEWRSPASLFEGAVANTRRPHG